MCSNKHIELQEALKYQRLRSNRSALTHVAIKTVAQTLVPASGAIHNFSLKATKLQ